MKEKGCFIPVASIGVIIRSKEGRMIGIANHDGGYDYALPAETFSQRLNKARDYQQALLVIEGNKVY